MMLGLETERLIFRQWHSSDFEQFHSFHSSEEDARYVGGVKSAEESWRLMATYIGHFELFGYSYLAVIEKQTKCLLGTVGLWNSTPWPEPELGYWLFPECQGKGFGIEAGIAIKKLALEKLKLESLVSYIDPLNVPSKKLASRLGAKYEGNVQLLSFGPHEIFRYW